MAGSFANRKSALHGALFLRPLPNRTKQSALEVRYWFYLRQW